MDCRGWLRPIHPLKQGNDMIGGTIAQGRSTTARVATVHRLPLRDYGPTPMVEGIAIISH